VCRVLYGETVGRVGGAPGRALGPVHVSGGGSNVRLAQGDHAAAGIEGIAKAAALCLRLRVDSAKVNE
jgi:hypothetical protein